MATETVPQKKGKTKPEMRDEITRRFGQLWARKAQDRGDWKLAREGLLHRANPP